jgi:hypothetical protein
MTVRPAWQRAWIKWHAANLGRFVIPLRQHVINRHGIELRFEITEPDALQVHIHARRCHFPRGHRLVELMVSCHTLDGSWWDMLLDLEAGVVRRSGGWTCWWCEQEGKRPMFPSREALWADHLYEPLLAWTNERLAPARALALTGGGGWQAGWLWKRGQPDSQSEPLVRLVRLLGAEEKCP